MKYYQQNTIQLLQLSRLDLLMFIFVYIKISNGQFSLKYYSMTTVITIESSHFHICYYKNIKWTIIIKILFDDYGYHAWIFSFSYLLI